MSSLASTLRLLVALVPVLLGLALLAALRWLADRRAARNWTEYQRVMGG